MKFESPVWVARITTAPAPVTVMVLPLAPVAVAGPLTTEKETGKALEAVALVVNGAAPTVLPASAPKVIV